jgi:hypothetical protein
MFVTAEIYGFQRNGDGKIQSLYSAFIGAIYLVKTILNSWISDRRVMDGSLCCWIEIYPDTIIHIMLHFCSLHHFYYLKYG